MWSILLLVLVAMVQLGFIGVALLSRVRRPAVKPLTVVVATVLIWVVADGLRVPLGSRFAMALAAIDGIAAAIVGMSTVEFCLRLLPSQTHRFRPFRLLAYLCLAAVFTPVAYCLSLPHSVIAEPMVYAFTLGSMIALALLLLLGIIVLFRLVRGVKGYVGQQARYVLAALIIFCVGNFIDIGYQLHQSAPVLHLFGSLFAVCFSAIAVYACTCIPLFGAARILRGSTATMLTATILVGVSGLLVPSVEDLLFGVLKWPMRTANQALALLSGMAFLPLYLRALRWSARLFSSRGPDPHQVVAEAREVLATALDRQVLTGTLAKTLAELFQPEHFAIYLQAADGQLVRLAAARRGAVLPISLMKDDPVVRFLQESRTPLFAEALRYQPEPAAGIGKQLQAWDVPVAYPLANGTEPHGMILLGEKSDGGAYTVEDMALLRQLCQPAVEAFLRSGTYEELASSKEALVHLVTQQENELASTRSRLHKVDHANDQFLAIISHELQTPLTNILGWAGLAEESMSPEITAKALAIIRNNALRQKRLVDDLLDASRLTYDKLGLEREYTNFWTLAEQSVDGVQQQAMERQITVHLDPPVEALFIHADPMRIVQVITNLLTNALKFTDPGGRITVRGSVRGEYACVAVEDTGHGIAPDELDTIFDLFQQGESQKRSGRGLGLGLALVKGMVLLHSGRVSVTSRGVGRGSTFTVELPLARAEAAVPASV